MNSEKEQNTCDSSMCSPVSAIITMPDDTSMEFVIQYSYNTMCAKKFKILGEHTAQNKAMRAFPQFTYEVERIGTTTELKGPRSEVAFETCAVKITMPDLESMDNVLVCAHSAMCGVKNKLYCSRVQAGQKPLFVDVPFEAKIID